LKGGDTIKRIVKLTEEEVKALEATLVKGLAEGTFKEVKGMWDSLKPLKKG